MAQAARRAGLSHVIWSTLEDSRQWVPLDDARMPTLQGKYKVPHFDAKGEASQLFLEPGVPTTLLLTSFYWENLIYFGMGPKRGPDGTLLFTMPMVSGSCRASPRRTSAVRRTASSRRDASMSAGPWALPANT